MSMRLRLLVTAVSAARSKLTFVFSLSLLQVLRHEYPYVEYNGILYFDFNDNVH